MNRKGQVIIYAIMIATVVILLAFALAPVVTEFSAISMNGTSGDTLGLNCTNGSISSYDRATCYVQDLYAPYFIGIMLFIGGGAVLARIVFD
jgi:hypothetical protein